MAELIHPQEVLQRLQRDVPAPVQPDFMLIGSLAVALHFRDRLSAGVRTKDADLVLHPAGKLEACRAAAESLLAKGWQRRRPKRSCYPLGADTPAKDLRAIRLFPPDDARYFVEFLTVPAVGQQEAMHWERVVLEDGVAEEHRGHYGVPSFRYLGLLQVGTLPAEIGGFRYAAPSMMALAALLSHRRPLDRETTMSEAVGDRTLRRCSKDLGRVLTLSHLCGAEQVLDQWAGVWAQSLGQAFPAEVDELVRTAGGGLEDLLADPVLRDEAVHSCVTGLLVGQGVGAAALQAAGVRVLGGPLRELGGA